jgi:hypothetical protein
VYVRFTLFARTQILFGMAECRKSKISYTLLAFECMRAAAITPPRGKVHFHNSERFYWKIIVAESGVGGGRRRVLVAQTAYTAWPTPFPGRSHSHTHAAHTNTHTTESEREKSWQCKISEYATFPLQRKNVG